MFVLGIETSCDETAAAVVGPAGALSDVIHGQEVHSEYGGVVPELASRAHADKIVVAVRAALDRAGLERPDGVAATAGPGLMGAVLVGLCYGKALAAGWDVPFIAVNHLEAHLLSPMLDDPAPAFPFLSLVVSGGHTAIYQARDVGDYTILGQTIDDAAGEAYDKVARLLGLSYPGGPPVDALARQGDPAAVAFPRPAPRVPGSPGRQLPKGAQAAPVRRRGKELERRPLDMSFSGLKTAVRNHVQGGPARGGPVKRASDRDVAASFQEAVVDVLCDRVVRAARDTGIPRVAVGGGVAANSRLRERLVALPLDIYLPPLSRCTDNGAMIANVGRLRLMAGQRDPLSASARAAWAPGT